MKKNQIEFSTIDLVGSLFVSDSIAQIAQRKCSAQSEKDYNLPPGIKFSDQTSRAFSIAKALYAEYASKNASFDSLKNFVFQLFGTALDYTGITEEQPAVIGGVKYPVTTYVTPNVPLVIVPADLSLDMADARFTIEGVTSRKKSGYALAQMFLNAIEPCTWAIVTNGRELRLLRDSESLVRPSYLSFNIESILKEDRYPDFVAFWCFMQASRVNVWEQWRTEGILQGTRVREGLRTGVTNALLYLGAGFLKTEGPGNNVLLNSLAEGKRPDGAPYTVQVFYKALLREVYRFLFLSTIEERGLIFAHPSESGTDAELEPRFRNAHRLYWTGYSVHRLAERAKKAIRTDRYTDLWHGVKVVYKAFQEGNDNLDLMPLGGLFKADQCPLLDACELDNEHLMKAIRQLRWNDIDDVKTFTDYRNMGTEEFGSVYESLLELVPHVDLQAKTFSFVGVGDEDGIIEDGSTKGNARKLSGSYYTDASLVQSLVKTALEPAIEAKLKAEEDLARKEKREPDYERAILDFRMIDAGSGSGHFLLAGSRRLAEVLSEKRLEKTGESATAETYRKALRDVITNCIYGVDLNEMAVELARTALWLEGYEPGKPLEFLNHHIKQGNSLVGVFDLKVLNDGIPAAAYTALIGDDKAVCTATKKTNDSQSGKKSQQSFLKKAKPLSNERLAKLTRDIEALPNDNLASEERKRALYEKLLNDADYIRNRAACDLYTAAFFAKKTDPLTIPTSEDVYDVMNDLAETKQGVRELAAKLSEEYSFFHWPVEFPEVFAKGGFDCVVGNPPWEVSQLKEVEFFANLLPEIAMLNGNDRKIAIDQLKKDRPHIYELYEIRKHALEAENTYYGNSGRFPLTSFGKVNLYSKFAELNYRLRNERGTTGFVCPSGIATDDSTKAFFGEIASKGKLHSLYDFENKEGIFPNVHRMFKFCLLTIAAGNTPGDFAFFLKNVPELEDKRRHFSMTADDFDLINPNTHTCPVFRSQEDAELAKKIYRKAGVFIRESDDKNGNPWNIKFQQMYNMTSASDLFAKVSGEGADGKMMLPLYEPKMMHQMDHRWATFVNGKTVDISLVQKADVGFVVQPEYWVPYTETVLRSTTLDSSVVSALRKEDGQKLRELCLHFAMTETDADLQKVYLDATKSDDIVQKLLNATEKYCPKYLMGWRGVTNAMNERTMIASVMPFCGVGHNTQLLSSFSQGAVMMSCLLANFNALPFDFVSRTKIGGSYATMFVTKQLPVLPPAAFTETAINFIVPRVFALTYTATDIVEWARALWNDASVDLRKLIIAQHKDLPTGTDINALAASDFDPASIPPIVFEDSHRAGLRAELDAYFAKLYGLSRRDLEYILDPKTVMGDDYPSETFRVLRDAELSTYGEYRTQRLVLEAWDKMN
ncbi:Eco57I restriction-modification methylase [Fibrobacter sp. UWB16]|uniref:Eco57I restriction-modification methylase domain-containing protein n=1 Tax=Fibrobacter sp. UWB16 TaxID=1945874 RepID=UPI000BCF19EC|nr:Eco57I restriction-modification methylase domain-containing protein [Fibrobacter sp. UWB16]SOD17434.1 Eco57I restriction-modification methylase [Fibrobacter sp. UWB16]